MPGFFAPLPPVNLNRDNDRLWLNSQMIQVRKVRDAPWGRLGYAQSTTNQTGITTVTDVTGVSVTVDVGEARTLRISGSVRVIQRTGAGTAFAEIREGSTSIDRIGVHTLQTNEIDMFLGTCIIQSPSAGSHTYKLSVGTTANTIDTQDGANFPHYILVEDIGPT